MAALQEAAGLQLGQACARCGAMVAPVLPQCAGRDVGGDQRHAPFGLQQLRRGDRHQHLVQHVDGGEAGLQLLRGDEGIGHLRRLLRVLRIEVELQVDAAMRGVEAGKPRDQPARAEAAAHGKAQRRAAHADDVVERGLQAREGGGEPFRQPASGVGQRDAAARPGEQLFAQRLGEVAQLVADSTLRHAQFLRRQLHRLPARHGLEVMQAADQPRIAQRTLILAHARLPFIGAITPCRSGASAARPW